MAIHPPRSLRRRVGGNERPARDVIANDDRAVANVLRGDESRIEAGGQGALLGMPSDDWLELVAFGTIEDAHAHVADLDRVTVMV